MFTLALTLTLAQWPTWLVMSLMGLFMVVCIIMVLTVLIQRPQGGGLAGAFGSGAGSGQTAFGTKTGDALTWMTIGVFIIFLLIAIVLNAGVKSVVGASNAKQPEAQTQDGGAAPAGTTPAETSPAGTTPADAANTTPTTPQTTDVVPTTPPATTPAETAPAQPAPAAPAPTTPAPTNLPTPAPVEPTPAPQPKP